MPAVDTELALSGVGVPPYSARGLTQTLEPIDQAAVLVRTANGGIANVGLTGFQKYASRVQCRDLAAPAFAGLWPGQLVTVDCIVVLGYGSGGAAGRTAVPGSTVTEGDYTYFRPRLDMVVTGFTVDRDEWGAYIGWTLDLEEV